MNCPFADEWTREFAPSVTGCTFSPSPLVRIAPLKKKKA
jgi:hypothetical protein